MQTLVWKDLDEPARARALARPSSVVGKEVEATVARIFSDIEKNGDDALRRYTREFDEVDLETPVLNLDRLEPPDLPDDAVNALKTAMANIRRFHEAQKPKDFSLEITAGVACQKAYRPLETVGLYVPGGSAPLVSTLMMLTIPAQVAGVEKIIIATPPEQGENLVDPAILWTAKTLGLKRLYLMGGAQAVAAMTYGTEAIPKADKLFGPGNIWVDTAKRYAANLPGGPAIDLPAGPSEVLVYADKTANPAFVAADLLAQAEHDQLAQVVLVTSSTSLASRVGQEVQAQLQTLPRKEIAAAALEKSRLIFVEDDNEALSVINAYAPEHLILNVEAPENLIPEVKNAGSVFLGSMTPESVGDYASGTNHVLPTGGAARAFSGLGTEAFMTSMTIQELDESGLINLGPAVETLAELEGLDAHKRAVSLRLENLKSRRAS